MISNYTISNLQALKVLPKLDVAQFTLNSHTFPSHRKVVENLSSMRDCHKTRLYIHYDYVYIISRFAMFSPVLQKVIVDEIESIMNYKSHGGNEVQGIIMHTDFPYRKTIYQTSGLSKEFVSGVYSSTIWNPETAYSLYQQYIEPGDLKGLYYHSFNLFYHCVKSRLSEFSVPIYLENTTKVPITPELVVPGTVDFLIEYLQSNPHTTDLYGLCLDTEHDFAVTGEFRFPSSVDFNVLVHLNTIPAEVSAKSLKDLHSNTTLFECSVNPMEFYIDYIKKLADLDIDFVREVKYETMVRELDQLTKI